MARQAAPPLVLVAEDEPQMLELVTRHLKSLADPRLEVLEASDGDEAWRLAQEHLPDLVVLDVMMPGMSGWEVCRKIREDVSLAHTSVLMLTGIGENLNQMTSPLYGADAYIDKPFEFEELDAKLKEALSARAPQRESVSRPSRDGTNGVGGPARAASPSGKGARKKAGKKAKKGSAAAAPKGAKKKTSRKQYESKPKGRNNMAAKKKKAAKKGAKKSKKTAKKK
jgi:DNA-binding response OmpR family regulator